jgi:uncharacterized membrane-anchored protein YhcB (DUF1043 family)
MDMKAPFGVPKEPEEKLREILKTPVKPPPREPTRAKRFLRAALRWSTALLSLVALGIIAMWLLRVRPMADQLRDLQAELDAAHTQVESLSAEVESLRPLQATLMEKNIHLAILQTLVDVTSAQLSLAQEQPVEAALALTATDDRLVALQAQLQAHEAESVGEMRDRLALVLTEIGRDDFAAKGDLEIFANSLLALERSLFGE